MKFLGMQIMVEGLALGAFGTLYKRHQGAAPQGSSSRSSSRTRRATSTTASSRSASTSRRRSRESERREREDWAFEVALLMRNRFLAYEVYEEWFAHRLTRAQWRTSSPTRPA